MNEQRMIERGVCFSNRQRSFLLDYELKFNKLLKNGSGAANIMYSEGSIVEGVLYEVEDIQILDKYEGYPKHYDRIILNVCGKPAWVYIAQQNMIKEGLKPKKEYLNHLLLAKGILSEEYINFLEKTEYS